MWGRSRCSATLPGIEGKTIKRELAGDTALTARKAENRPRVHLSTWLFNSPTFHMCKQRHREVKSPCLTSNSHKTLMCWFTEWFSAPGWGPHGAQGRRRGGPSALSPWLRSSLSTLAFPWMSSYRGFRICHLCYHLLNVLNSFTTLLRRIWVLLPNTYGKLLPFDINQR